MYQIIMLQLCIQCAEIVCGYVLRIFLLVYPIELFNDGRRILDDPETIVVLIKIAFLMEISNLIENMLENRRCYFTKWFSTARA